MGAVVSYALAVAVYLFAGWLVFRLFVRKGTPAGWERIIILAIFGGSVAAPWLSRVIAQLFTRPTLSVGVQDAVPFDVVIEQAVSQSHTPLWCSILVLAYWLGVSLMLVRSLYGWLCVARTIRAGQRIDRDGNKLVVSGGDRSLSFSWGNIVVISSHHAPGDFEMVMAHELAHRDHRHWLDLLLAQAVCIFQWFNPAAWWLTRELKAVHEYQADAAVVGSGVDVAQYQRLLVRTHIASRNTFMVNTFESSNLKKRISMMNNNAKSNRRWHIRALALVPALAVAFGLTQIPAVASALTATSSVKLADEVNTVSADEVNTVSAEIEVRPQFPGGEGALMQWLSMNMKYPEAMIKADLQGREVVSFTVMPDGKVADAKIIKSVCPEADEEVLRLVAEMPDWVPGTVDGKPVAVSYALPVTFKLSGSNGKEENPVRIISVGADASEGAAESSVKVKSASEPDDHTIRVVGYGTKVASEGRTTETLQSDGSDGQGSPAIFVDGVRHNGDLSSIDSEDIQSVSAIKDSPDYPNGRIDITLKKK